MHAPLADQAARDRIRDDLRATLVVEAAAGTGKTTALVGPIGGTKGLSRKVTERLIPDVRRISAVSGTRLLHVLVWLAPSGVDGESYVGPDGPDSAF